jgi:hypothetical protein
MIRLILESIALIFITALVYLTFVWYVFFVF